MRSHTREEARGANASRHLPTLTNVHILARRKEGLEVFYSIEEPGILKLCDLAFGSLHEQIAKQAGAFDRAPMREQRPAPSGRPSPNPKSLVKPRFPVVA